MSVQDALDALGRRLHLGDRAAPGWMLALLAVAVVAPLALVFGRPLTIAEVFVNDSLVFFDGIHRTAAGQLPHVDYSTPVGALAYWLPYLGAQAVGGFAGAVETASVLLACLVVPIAAFLAWRRMAPVMALIVLGTIAGVIVVPLVPGWDVSEISHAMHYNRWSWGLISTLFLLGLRPPAGAGPGLSRGLAGGLILAALFLIKITYFLVGGVFLILLLAAEDGRRRDALVALLAAALALGATFAATGEMIPRYLDDIARALTTDQPVRDSYLRVAYSNHDSLIFLILAAYVALLAGGLRWLDLVLAGYVATSGLAIIDQNFQFTFIVSLPVAFALLVAPPRADGGALRLGQSVVPLMAAAMLLPFAADWARVIARYGPDGGDYVHLSEPGFTGFLVGHRPPELAMEDRPWTGPVEGPEFWLNDRRTIYIGTWDYLATLDEAVALWREAAPGPATVFAFDYTNVMPMLVDAPREPNGFSWYHFGRNVSKEGLPPGPEFFDGVDYVMVPLRSLYGIANSLREVYGEYLSTRTTLVARSPSWLLFRLDRTD